MQMITLEWVYVDRWPAYWQSTNKTIPAIRFYIIEGENPDTYTVGADVEDIEDTVCTGLENAKAKAQDIYTSYAIHLSLL